MMNGEGVFSIHHSVLHWAHQCSTGSYKCLFIWWFVCVIWKQNTILRRNNIVLNVKFHFAGELRGFAHCVCVFWFVCRVLRVWGMLSENVCKQLRKNCNRNSTICWGHPTICTHFAISLHIVWHIEYWHVLLQFLLIALTCLKKLESTRFLSSLSQ